jgi:hypothetical protein
MDDPRQMALTLAIQAGEAGEPVKVTVDRAEQFEKFLTRQDNG